MFGGRRFRDRNHRSRTDEEAQRDLTRRRAMRIRDAREHSAALAVACGEIVMTERRIGNDSDTMLLTPGDHRMLDRALLEMVEHLIAGDAALVRDAENFVEIIGIEIRNAPG